MGRGKLLPVLLLAGFAVGGAGAPAQDVPLPEGAHPLPFVAVDRSLPDLLDDGFEIVSMNEGLGGSGFLLRKDRTWVMCTINPYGPADSPKLSTICQRLGRG